MRPAPRWILVSATAAPVLLIGGWTAAAARQIPDFDSATGTISALAGLGATDRWLMTAALTGVGFAHLTTAVGLRPAAIGGRLLLATGGAATLLVATFPLPRDGSSSAHTIAAGVAFAMLALWPAFAYRRGAHEPWGLRPAVSLVAAAVLVGLVGWFVATLYTGELVGLAERAAAGAQALWPLVVALTSVRSGGGRRLHDRSVDPAPPDRTARPGR